MVSNQVLDKLTTRNIIALATTGMVLFVVYTMITAPQSVIVTLNENEEYIIGGAIVFGVFLAKWSDQIQFYFRASGKKPTVENPAEEPTPTENTNPEQ